MDLIIPGDFLHRGRSILRGDYLETNDPLLLFPILVNMRFLVSTPSALLTYHSGATN
jgi:hypothetical protein